MGKKTLYFIIAVLIFITFLIPIIQLAIGFNHIVKNGQDPNKQCAAAPDLPMLMAFGGIFTLFFLGIWYGLLKAISSVTEQNSDTSGKGPKILIGLSCFIFGTITLIFFILIQIRVYEAYSNNVQFNNQSAPHYCQSAVMRGSLAVIILIYICMFVFVGVLVLVLNITRRKLEVKKQAKMDTQNIPVNSRL